MTASIIAALAAVVSAVISAIAAVSVARIENNSKQVEEKEKLRQEEMLLQGKMVAANTELAIVTATAVKGGHTNGDLEKAQEACKKARSEYNNLLEKIAYSDIGRQS